MVIVIPNSISEPGNQSNRVRVCSAKTATKNAVRDIPKRTANRNLLKGKHVDQQRKCASCHVFGRPERRKLARLGNTYPHPVDKSVDIRSNNLQNAIFSLAALASWR